MLAMALSAGLLLLNAAGCANRTELPPPAPIPVRTAEVRRADMEQQIAYLGTVHSEREILVTARLQGSVTRLPYREGDQVAAGDPVVELSAPDLHAATERLRADDIYWSSRLAADRRLALSGAIPQEQVAATTRAAASAAAALAEVEARHAWTREPAPIAGVVLQWRTEPGQHVLPGQPLVLVGGTAREIRIPVVEEDLRRGIGPGLRARVTTGGGAAFVAAVSEVAPAAHGTSRAFSVTIPVPPEHARDLRHGESAQVRFLVREEPDAAAVPLRALVDRGVAPHVYLVAAGRVQRWPVTLGVEQDGWIAITPPPPARARVAISNLEALVDGAVVFAVADDEVRP